MHNARRKNGQSGFDQHLSHHCAIGPPGDHGKDFRKNLPPSLKVEQLFDRDPEVIILGTLVVHFRELLLEPTRKSYEKYLFLKKYPPPTVPAKLGENLVIMATLSVLLEHREQI